VCRRREPAPTKKKIDKGCAFLDDRQQTNDGRETPANNTRKGEKQETNEQTKRERERERREKQRNENRTKTNARENRKHIDVICTLLRRGMVFIVEEEVILTLVFHLNTVTAEDSVHAQEHSKSQRQQAQQHLRVQHVEQRKRKRNEKLLLSLSPKNAGSTTRSKAHRRCSVFRY
jgi:hypothetical protein